MNKIIKLLVIIFILSSALFIVDRGAIMINDNIYENINYYKEDNLDRYLKYKDENNDLSYEEVINNVNINLDKSFYEDITDSINKHTNLVLVNKHYNLGEDYVPKELVQVNYRFTSGIHVMSDK